MHTKYLEALLAESEGELFGLPEGVSFSDEESTEELEDLVHSFNKFFSQKGYRRVNPPIFEYYETFERGSGKGIAQKTFSFKDKDNRLLTLRFDMTTPIARMVASKYTAEDLPLKLFYSGDVFREQPVHAGKPRVFRQTGVEIIGADKPADNHEAVGLLSESLAQMSDDYRLVLGDVRFYQACLKSLSLSETKQRALHALVEKKDGKTAAKILQNVDGNPDAKRFFTEITELTGKPEDLMKRISGVNLPGVGEAAEELMELFQALPASQAGKVLFDFALVKDFSYYTSLTMEGYVAGKGYPVANGGRYDSLFSNWGVDFPAVGFALALSQ